MRFEWVYVYKSEHIIHTYTFVSSMFYDDDVQCMHNAQRHLSQCSGCVIILGGNTVYESKTWPEWCFLNGNTVYVSTIWSLWCLLDSNAVHLSISSYFLMTLTFHKYDVLTKILSENNILIQLIWYTAKLPSSFLLKM